MRIDEPAALVSGYSALLLAVLARDQARKGYFDKVPAAHRAELLAVIDDMEAAGKAWRDRQAGTAAPKPAAPQGPSEIGTSVVASILGVGERRARVLMPELGGRKTRTGWVTDRDQVLAEAERRRRDH